MSRTATAEPFRGVERPATSPASPDCRCECGSLLARRVENGFEIKCRGCKRLIVLSPEPGDGAWREIRSGR
ncbi:MAG: hypothetical protein ACQGVK_11140 [Myxococcota bacterium]